MNHDEALRHLRVGEMKQQEFEDELDALIVRAMAPAFLTDEQIRLLRLRMNFGLADGLKELGLISYPSVEELEERIRAAKASKASLTSLGPPDFSEEAE